MWARVFTSSDAQLSSPRASQKLSSGNPALHRPPRQPQRPPAHQPQVPSSSSAPGQLTVLGQRQKAPDLFRSRRPYQSLFDRPRQRANYAAYRFGSTSPNAAAPSQRQSAQTRSVSVARQQSIGY